MFSIKSRLGYATERVLNSLPVSPIFDSFEDENSLYYLSKFDYIFILFSNINSGNGPSYRNPPPSYMAVQEMRNQSLERESLRDTLIRNNVDEVMRRKYR